MSAAHSSLVTKTDSSKELTSNRMFLMILPIADMKDAVGLAAKTPWINCTPLAFCIPDWCLWPVEQLMCRAIIRR